MLILGLLGMNFDAAVVFVTFFQIGCGHTVTRQLKNSRAEQQHYICSYSATLYTIF
jgi:hypothetical protein